MTKGFRLRAPDQRPESTLQAEIATNLRAYLPDDVWWTASLSGVPLSPQGAGAAKRAGMQKGAPDLSFVFPDGRTRYVEVKTVGGVLTPEQAALQKVLGRRMAVCHSWAEVRDTLTAWLALYGLRFLTDKESVEREIRRRKDAQLSKAG